jgi:hypothetical protein
MAESGPPLLMRALEEHSTQYLFLIWHFDARSNANNSVYTRVAGARGYEQQACNL